MGGEKGGKKEGGKGGKGGKGDKGGYGKGKGGGGGGGASADVPVRSQKELQHPADRYVPVYEFGEKAPRYTEGREAKDVVDEARNRVVSALDAVPHPASGTNGTPVDVVTNTVELTFAENTVIRQYDVKVSPEVKSRKTHRCLVQEALSAEMGPNFSCIVAGDIVFANQNIKATEVDFSPTDERQKKIGDRFKVTVKSVREVTTTKITQDLITVFSKLFRSVLDEGCMQKINRSYFDLTKAQQLPGKKLDVVPGVHLTLRPTNFGSGLALQIDVQHKIVSKQTIFEELNLSAASDKKARETLRFKVRDTICLTTYDGKDKKKRTVRIDDVDPTKDESTPLKELDGKSVKQYFETQYGLKVPKGQPLLVHKKPMRQGQEVAEVEYYLPSVLRLTGIVPEVYGSDVRQLMTDRCVVKPGVRFQKIKDMAGAVLRPFKELGGKWGCAPATGFVMEQARQLKGPVIEQSNGLVEEGTSWRYKINRRVNTTAKPIQNVRDIKQLLVACPRGAKTCWQENSTFLSDSVKHFSNGKNPAVRLIDMADFSADEVTRVFAEYKGKPDCVLFVTDLHDSPKNADAYKAAKVYGSKYGVVCQVVRPSSLEGKKGWSVCNNVAAQIHTKAGNQLWRKQGCRFEGTMAVGIAMSHAGDGAGRGERKSVMSIAASWDTELKAYNTKRVVLDAGKTIANNLAAPFQELVDIFKTKNGGKAPLEIVFFREGGSEGEIPLILELEVAALRKVLETLPGKKVNIVFFLVMRNSHMRVAGVDTFIEGSVRKATVSKAPPVGTVMDTGVVNPRGMEFYLLSQEASLGSPQSIKYKCLVYEGKKLEADKYQKMANDLASLYYNWTGPVALPAPIMYARSDAKLTGTCLLDDDGSLVEMSTSGKVSVPFL